MKGLLKEGDVIYYTDTMNRMTKITIKRVTRTQAISDHCRFRIEYDKESGYITQLSYTYSRSSYELETPELKEMYLKQLLVQKISKTKFDLFSVHDLEKIYNIIKNISCEK